MCGKGVALANALWNMYLGGSDRRYAGWRPFGPRVVLDGIDLDLEQTPPACSQVGAASAGCVRVQELTYLLRTYLLTHIETPPRPSKVCIARSPGGQQWATLPTGQRPAMAVQWLAHER